MENKFIAEAFIKMPDNKEIAMSIFERLSELKYKRSYSPNIDDDFIFIHKGYFATGSIVPSDDDKINCNIHSNDEELAIALFLELAQMNDNSHKWFAYWMHFTSPNRLELHYEKARNEMDLAAKYHTSRDMFCEITLAGLAQGVELGVITKNHLNVK